MTINNEATDFGIEIAKRVKERQEPLNNISAYYDEARKIEEDARAEAEALDIASQPPKALTTDEHIQLLTKTLAELTAKMGEK